jgi:hypothetical protein
VTRVGLHAPIIDYADSFSFPVEPAVLWRMIERFESFESWWGWLRDFEADGEGLVAGRVLRGVVTPPIPYRLSIVVRLVHCEPQRQVEAEVRGDLLGAAKLRLVAEDGGTRVLVAWSLEMVREPLRTASRVAYPLVRWGHDRVVDLAVSGFSRRALGDVRTLPCVSSDCPSPDPFGKRWSRAGGNPESGTARSLPRD